MKIPLVYIPRTKLKKFLFIEKRFTAPNLIIPIGCDCHPAYSLQKLHIRTKSFPFDWLNTKAAKGIHFVEDNITLKFKYFLDGLALNAAGNIVSARYPYAEFIHEKSLIENTESKKRFERRIKRLLDTLQIEKTDFLFNIPVTQITNADEAEELTTTITSFTDKLNNGNKLYIYLRYDESFEKNTIPADFLFTALQSNENVSVVKYIRHLKQFGIWGDKHKYPDLFNRLGIKLKPAFPKIYIK